MKKFFIIGSACLWVSVSGCNNQEDDETGLIEQESLADRTKVDLMNDRLFELEDRVSSLEAAARATEDKINAETPQPSGAASSSLRTPGAGSKLIKPNSRDQ